MYKNEFKPVMDLLDKVTNYAIDEFFTSKGLDIGPVGILIHRKRGAYGYCYSSDNWNIEDNNVREIALTPACLTKGKEQIINTALHEAVHAYDCHNGIKDGSGKNHNKNFKKTCDLIGLGCEKGEKYGYTTSPELNSEECKARIESIFAKLTDNEIYMLDHMEEVLPEKEEKEKKDRNLAVYICPNCGAKARAKKDAHLICGDCMLPMECDESDN